MLRLKREFHLSIQHKALKNKNSQLCLMTGERSE